MPVAIALLYQPRANAKSPQRRDGTSSAKVGISFLRMVRRRAQISVKQLLSGWLIPTRGRLDGNEYRIDGTEKLGILYAKNPALLSVIVDIEYAQILGRSAAAFTLAPGLKCNFGRLSFVAE